MEEVLSDINPKRPQIFKVNWRKNGKTYFDKNQFYDICKYFLQLDTLERLKLHKIVQNNPLCPPPRVMHLRIAPKAYYTLSFLCLRFNVLVFSCFSETKVSNKKLLKCAFLLLQIFHILYIVVLQFFLLFQKHTT